MVDCTFDLASPCPFSLCWLEFPVVMEVRTTTRVKYFQKIKPTALRMFPSTALSRYVGGNTLDLFSLKGSYHTERLGHIHLPYDRHAFGYRPPKGSPHYLRNLTTLLSEANAVKLQGFIVSSTNPFATYTWFAFQMVVHGTLISVWIHFWEDYSVQLSWNMF